eukprot:CAMPEP_0172331722 /NCGR_PEP_ID=MMETSP1058-20130122/62072_1 /TAXON_ID=83371 /ORGANISM="Detonula confervacea, Strain CCMP 353" /LENGTH=76 /DNA_ID=CAMNT_0013048991 /DNA_START=402 /DNA_END=632 /DNA_ORIENTATION=+
MADCDAVTRSAMSIARQRVDDDESRASQATRTVSPGQIMRRMWLAYTARTGGLRATGGEAATVYSTFDSVTIANLT